MKVKYQCLLPSIFYLTTRIELLLVHNYPHSNHLEVSSESPKHLFQLDCNDWTFSLSMVTLRLNKAIDRAVSMEMIWYLSVRRRGDTQDSNHTYLIEKGRHARQCETSISLSLSHSPQSILSRVDIAKGKRYARDQGSWFMDATCQTLPYLMNPFPPSFARAEAHCSSAMQIILVGSKKKRHLGTHTLG